MATIDQTFTVNAAAPTVFGYLTDPEQATVWQSSLLEARFEPEGEIRPGTTIHEVRKLLGRRIESTVEVTEFEPNRVFGGRTTSGPIPWHFTYRFDSEHETTRVAFHMEGEPGGFFRLAEPIVVRTVEKQLANDFSTLKELVEKG